MTNIITKIVKCKWYIITLILSNINVTFAISWTSVSTSQMTVISNFIRFNICFTKSTNAIFSLMFFNFLRHNDIFFSVFKIESHFIS